MGVWIETGKYQHSLAGLKVTPCMGVWIETLVICSPCSSEKSHPVWVCGLKLGEWHLVIIAHSCHTLYGCVD